MASHRASEPGKYPDAGRMVQTAPDLANANSNTALAGLLRSQIALYNSGKPFRDDHPGP